MRKTHDDGFEMYRMIEERVKVNSSVTSLRGSEVSDIRNHIETIRRCNNIIMSVSRLLTEFQVDNECGNEIPASVKSGFVIGGLLDALEMAVEDSELSAEYLQDKFKEQSSE